MKRFSQKYFNRYRIIDILERLSCSNTQIYFAVSIMESLRITSVDDAIDDKLLIYNDYVNGKLKYLNAVRISSIEEIIKSFLIKNCPMTNELLQNCPDTSVKQLIEYYSHRYPQIATTAKCIFSFFYVVSLGKIIAYPTFKMAFLPYSLEKFRGIGSAPSNKNDQFLLYFELDLQKPDEIMSVTLGADEVLLLIANEKDSIQYCIHIEDEQCCVSDYCEECDILLLLNDVVKDDSTSFCQITNMQPEDILESFLHPDPNSPYSLLEENNITGEIYPDKALYDEWSSNAALGAVIPPDLIAGADQNKVGDERNIKFSMNEDKIPFAYTYDPASGDERLALFLYHSDTVWAMRGAGNDFPFGIPMLVICETSFGGVSEFCRAVREGGPFGIRVLAVSNIGFDSYYAASEAIFYDDTDGASAINVNAPEAIECDTVRVIGAVGGGGNLLVRANLTTDIEEAMSTSYMPIQNVIDSFGLGESMRLEPDGIL